MKKALSLIISLVMIFSLFAATVAAEGDPKVVKVNMSQLGYANAAAVETVDAGDGVTLTFAQGTTASNVPKYYTTGAAVRMYTGNTLTVSSSSDTITGIVFSYVSGYEGDTFADNVSDGTYEDGKWEGEASSVTFTNGASSQVRITEISVLLNGASEEPPVTYETPEEILAAAYELANGATLANGPYTLEGVITEVIDGYSESYGNITVMMKVDGVTAENNTIECFRMKNATGVDGVDKIDVGDHIKVKGEIQNYKGTVEFTQNCTLEEYTLSPRFMTQQLSLAGDLGVHFYLDLSSLSDDERAASYMEFTVNEKTTRVDFDADHTNAKGTYYGFTCRINALQIAETITAVYHYGDKTVQKKYSAADYILYIAEHIDDYDKDTVLLAIAIWDYGYYAQQYLNECNNVALGEGGIKGEYKMIDNYLIEVDDGFDTETFYDIYAMDKWGDLYGGARFTYCLLLDSQIALEMYVTVPEGEEVQTIEAYFGYLDETYDQVEDLGGGRYRLTIANIPTTKLDERFDFVYAESHVRTLSPMSYAASVLHNENSSGKAVDCMKALVNLFECAITYAENN